MENFIHTKNSKTETMDSLNVLTSVRKSRRFSFSREVNSQLKFVYLNLKFNEKNAVVDKSPPESQFVYRKRPPKYINISLDSFENDKKENLASTAKSIIKTVKSQIKPALK